MPDTQYFTNIDGKYVKDAEARQQLNDLEDYVESLDQPWQPLEDGYSNFWFELTNDTLSPWLNFSAKTDSAVIDWGDGSGEQALTTLTPTHTYAKAGKYVVKVKGVTGIAAQNTSGYKSVFLKYIELNNEVTNIASYGFEGCVSLEQIVVPYLPTIGGALFRYCANLKKVYGLKNIMGSSAASNVASCFSLRNVAVEDGAKYIGNSSFRQDICLLSVTLPSSVEEIGNFAFYECKSLEEVHILATEPPTLGTDVFKLGSANYIIYVPVGYAETYKSAAGWSSYADHIVEEGQTPTRAMLARFKKSADDDESMVVDK